MHRQIEKHCTTLLSSEISHCLYGLASVTKLTFYDTLRICIGGEKLWLLLVHYINILWLHKRNHKFVAISSSIHKCFIGSEGNHALISMYHRGHLKWNDLGSTIFWVRSKTYVLCNMLERISNICSTNSYITRKYTYTILLDRFIFEVHGCTQVANEIVAYCVVVNIMELHFCAVQKQRKMSTEPKLFVSRQHNPLHGRSAALESKS